jgi:hypothetical protein
MSFAVNRFGHAAFSFPIYYTRLAETTIADDFTSFFFLTRDTAAQWFAEAEPQRPTTRGAGSAARSGGRGTPRARRRSRPAQHGRGNQELGFARQPRTIVVRVEHAGRSTDDVRWPTADTALCHASSGMGSRVLPLRARQGHASNINYNGPGRDN